MTATKRTTRERELDSSSPFFGPVEAGRAIIRTLMGTAPADDDAKNIIIAKVEGIESMILLCQRAGAGEIVFERGQVLAKVERGRTPVDELDATLTLEERVRRLEERNGIAVVKPARTRALKLISPPDETTAKSSTVRAGMREVLVAAVQHPHGVTTRQLVTLTGFKLRTVGDYVFALRKSGLVESRNGRTFGTDAGRHELGPSFRPLPTGDALLAHWLCELPSGEAKILELVARVWPESMPRSSIIEATGFKLRTCGDYLFSLKRRELVSTPNRGEIKARDELFTRKGRQ